MKTILFVHRETENNVREIVKKEYLNREFLKYEVFVIALVLGNVQ